MRTETKYLCREVSAEGIKPDPEAVAKLQEWMPPRNKEELQSFLGVARRQSATHAGAIPKKSAILLER